MLFVVNLDLEDLITREFLQNIASCNNPILFSGAKKHEGIKGIEYVINADPYKAFLAGLKQLSSHAGAVILVIGHGMVINGKHFICIEPSNTEPSNTTHILPTRILFQNIDGALRGQNYDLVLISCYSGRSHEDFDSERGTLFTTSSPYTPVYGFDYTKLILPKVENGLGIVRAMLTASIDASSKTQHSVEETGDCALGAAAAEGPTTSPHSILHYKLPIPHEVIFTRNSGTYRYPIDHNPDEEAGESLVQMLSSQPVLVDTREHSGIVARSFVCTIDSAQALFAQIFVNKSGFEVLNFLLSGSIHYKSATGEEVTFDTIPANLDFTLDVYPHPTEKGVSNVVIAFISWKAEPTVSANLVFPMSNVELLKFFNGEATFQEIVSSLITVERLDVLATALMNEEEPLPEPIEKLVESSKCLLDNVSDIIESIKTDPINWYNLAQSSNPGVDICALCSEYFDGKPVEMIGVDAVAAAAAYDHQG